MISLLSLRNANVRRGGRLVLDGLDLDLPADRNVVVLGGNGAGKTTLLRLIAQELHPVWSPDLRFEILGRSRWNISDLRRELGMVSQELLLAHQRLLSGRDVVSSGFFGSIGCPPHLSLSDQQRRVVGEWLERFGVQSCAERAFQDLSTGEQRRLLLARALVGEPRWLVLDEPTANLDLVGSHLLLDLISEVLRSSERRVVVVTHRLEEVLPELDWIVLMRAGRVIASGPRAEVLTDENVSRTYGLPVHLLHHGGRVRAVPAASSAPSA